MLAGGQVLCGCEFCVDTLYCECWGLVIYECECRYFDVFCMGEGG